MLTSRSIVLLSAFGSLLVSSSANGQSTTTPQPGATTVVTANGQPPWGSPPGAPQAMEPVAVAPPTYVAQQPMPYGRRARTLEVYPGARWRLRDPVPPGWHLEPRRRTSRIVGGSVLFAVPWLLTSYFALQSPGAEWVAIPVFGPIVAGVYMFSLLGSGSCSGSSYGFFCGVGVALAVLAGFVLIADGLAQAAGLVLTGLGVLRPDRVIQPDQPGVAASRRSRLRWAVVPAAPDAVVGASFALIGF